MAWFLATTVWIYNSIAVGLAQASSYTSDDGKLHLLLHKTVIVEYLLVTEETNGDCMCTTDKCCEWQICIDVALPEFSAWSVKNCMTTSTNTVR